MRLDIDRLTLERGAHVSPQDGLCVMEALAYIARERHSDSPQCVSPVIATFLRTWNDAMSDEDRQQLKPLIPVVMDTVSTPEDEERRAWMCVDWLVREYTPAWLRLTGLSAWADTLARLPRFRSGMDVSSIGSTIDSVRRDAVAARDAAEAAAGDAAESAARATAGAAVWAAVEAAAGDAAGVAAAGAAWDVAAAAAGAARAAAGAAVWAAEAAAESAAEGVLRPTVIEMQASALRLVERMAWLKDGEDDERFGAA